MYQDDYLNAVHAVATHLDGETQSLDAAADVMVDAMLGGHALFTAEVGHGNQNDWVNRAGGLAALRNFRFTVSIVDTPPKRLADRPRPEGSPEVHADLEHVRHAVRVSQLRPGDVMLVGSVSGRNRVPVELALAAVDQRLRDEGIRNNVSLIVGGSIRSSADVVKAIALGADACYIATAALLAMGCHLCRSCQTGRCCWGIATQRPDLVKRLDPQQSAERLVNLVTAWKHEIKEMMGGMGINSIEALKGNRLMLRGVGMTDKELEILGISHAGE